MLPVEVFASRVYFVSRGCLGILVLVSLLLGVIITLIGSL